MNATTLTIQRLAYLDGREVTVGRSCHLRTMQCCPRTMQWYPQGCTYAVQYSAQKLFRPRIILILMQFQSTSIVCGALPIYADVHFVDAVALTFKR